METTDNQLLERALQIATAAHKGQVDKSGSPYIFHPIRVSNRCLTVEEKIVALLHDTIEDTDITEKDLVTAGFPRNIIDAVLSLTHPEGESYEEYLKRCCLNPIGRKVKLHDLEDNMDITRLQQLTEQDLPRLNKYLKAYRYVTDKNR